MGITNADTLRNRRAAQRRIRRRCPCGRIVTGNAAWWSHLNVNRPECGYAGRA